MRMTLLSTEPPARAKIPINTIQTDTLAFTFNNTDRDCVQATEEHLGIAEEVL